MLVKATPSKCKQCEYVYRKESERSKTDPVCNYLGKTGEFRAFKDGKLREDLKPGYCDKYKKRKVK